MSSQPPISVTFRDNPVHAGVLHAKVSGELELLGSNYLWETVSPLLNRESSRLLVDMEDVQWMSSAGLGALMRLFTRVESLGGRMAIYGLRERVRRIIEITSLESVLNVRATASDALKVLGLDS